MCYIKRDIDCSSLKTEKQNGSISWNFPIRPWRLVVISIDDGQYQYINIIRQLLKLYENISDLCRISLFH